MNAFGERQHVGKFIPLCIKKLLNNEKIYIHSYPDKKKAGTVFIFMVEILLLQYYF